MGFILMMGVVVFCWYFLFSCDVEDIELVCDEVLFDFICFWKFCVFLVVELVEFSFVDDFLKEC